MRFAWAIFKDMLSAAPALQGRKPDPMIGKKPKGDAAKSPKRKRRLVDPTKDAPFKVDPESDGDFALPRNDLSEDDLKEQEDRRS